jgi:hypothetical protein
MTDQPIDVVEYHGLRAGLAYGLMLDDDASEADVLAEVLRLARAANEHFDLLVQAADAWRTLSPLERIAIGRGTSARLHNVLGAISTFVSVHRKPAPPERNWS